MPQSDKSSYSGKQRRAWATVNKQTGGAKGKSSHSSSSHSGGSRSSKSHSGSHKSSRSRHSGSHSGSRSRSRGRSRSRSRSRGFSMFGVKLPKSTPYVLGCIGLCGLVYGLLQIDSIRETIDPVIDDVGEFFGLSERPELMAHRSFDSSMSTIH